MPDISTHLLLEEIRDINASTYELLLRLEENTYDTTTEMTFFETVSAQYLQSRELMYTVTGIYFMMLVAMGFFFVFAYKKWRNR